MSAMPSRCRGPEEKIMVSRIQPSSGWATIDLPELWQHRELLLHLVWRDIRMLFRNTGLGILWIVLQPLLIVVVTTLVLGLFVRVPTNGIPYPVVVLSGLVLFQYFSTAVLLGASSMVGNAYLLSKVYFPRLIIPCVPILTSLVDFIVLLVVLLVVTMVYGLMPRLSWFVLPVPILINILLALGMSLWLSALNIQFRDVSKFIPVMFQVGIYASPIFYLSNLVPEKWYLIYALNPMVGLIDSFRWALLGQGAFPGSALMISLIAALFISITGTFVFRRMEENAADII